MLDKGRNIIYNYDLRYVITQMEKENSKETDCDNREAKQSKENVITGDQQRIKLPHKPVG